jgi:17beta-estradiol 17-dehydrogenase / very-long-chain 3-oxoacyl-CoA reductase
MYKLRKNFNRSVYLVGGVNVGYKAYLLGNSYMLSERDPLPNYLNPVHYDRIKRNMQNYATESKELPGKRWALVTGASEGIGREFAKNLAQTGLFNIAIASRSEDKLNEVKNLIHSINQNIEVRVIPVDLANCETSRYREMFEKDLADVPLSIVINNAGKANKKKIFEADPDILSWMVKLNMIAYTFVAVHARNKFSKMAQIDNNQKFGLIDTSSIVGTEGCWLPVTSTYSATKMYASTFHNILFQWN